MPGVSRVVVIGSINIDLVVSVPHLPVPGETVLGGHLERHFGGKGANQAVAAARAGAAVTMIGAVGRDPDGEGSLAALAADGVDVLWVRQLDAPTGMAVISVAPDGENQIVVAPGANASLSRADAALPGLAGGPGVLLASLEVPMAAVVEAVAAAARLGMTAIVNPAPALALPEELLAHRPILVPNEHELPACVGAPDGEAAIASLRQRQITVVVTRGAAGCLLVDGESRVEMPAAPPAAVLDTTGAGDTFCGVLAAWLAEGRPIREAAQAATVAAGLSVAAPGPRAGMPDRRELELALHALTEVDPT